MTTRPLVSFLLSLYNQERFVREAVEGALAQTYQPLEIVISDDASPDGSFEVAREVVASYDGPHRVTLRRNPTNLGLCGHVSRLAEESAGRYLVMAHGDDISLPQRTEVTVSALEADPRLVAVTTRARLIDERGKRIDGWDRQSSLYGERPASSRRRRVERFLRAFRPALFGGATTWRRELFDLFGPLAKDSKSEDLALSFRAHLLGEVATVEDVGFSYRIHHDNTSLTDGQAPALWAKGKYSEAARVTWLGVQASLYPQLACDLERADELGVVDFDPAPSLREIKRREEVARLLAEQPEQPLSRRLAITARVLARLPEPRTLRAAALRVLPRRTVAALRGLRPPAAEQSKRSSS